MENIAQSNMLNHKIALPLKAFAVVTEESKRRKKEGVPGFTYSSIAGEYILNYNKIKGGYDYGFDCPIGSDS